MEAIQFSGNSSFWYKVFLLVEAISLKRSHSFVKAIPFIESHSSKWKPFCLGNTILLKERPFTLE